MLKKWASEGLRPGQHTHCVPTFNGNDDDDLCLGFEYLPLVYICSVVEVK